MRPTTALLLLTGILACSDTDLRNATQERTRDADGIIKRYQNREQGDWMLKGKIILVEHAVVTETGRQGLVATGQTSLNPIPLSVRFSESEKRGRGLAAGDLITFKGRCKGMNGSIGFESCFLLSITKPASLP